MHLIYVEFTTFNHGKSFHQLILNHHLLCCWLAFLEHGQLAKKTFYLAKIQQAFNKVIISPYGNSC